MENSRFKLRAWVVNKSVSEMIYPNETDMNSAIAYALWFKLGYINQYPEKTNIEDWQKEIVFMQYTGLKDNKGKEIYEGDILIYMGAKGVVYYCNDSCMFMTKFNIHNSNYSFDSMDEEIEVIGNIYENNQK